MGETVQQPNHSIYTLTSGSRFYVLPDGSGIAVYCGQTGDTLFLNAKEPFEPSESPPISANFSIADLQHHLRLDNGAVEFIVARLQEQHVIQSVN